MRIFFAAAALALILGGCYEVPKPIFETGEQVPIAGTFTCTNMFAGSSDPRTETLTETKSGYFKWADYRYSPRSGNGERMAVKNISGTLYAAQVEASEGIFVVYLDVPGPDRFSIRVPNLMSQAMELDAMANRHGIQIRPSTAHPEFIRLDAPSDSLTKFILDQAPATLITVFECHRISVEPPLKTARSSSDREHFIQLLMKPTPQDQEVRHRHQLKVQQLLSIDQSAAEKITEETERCVFGVIYDSMTPEERQVLHNATQRDVETLDQKSENNPLVRALRDAVNRLEGPTANPDALSKYQACEWYNGPSAHSIIALQTSGGREPIVSDIKCRHLQAKTFTCTYKIIDDRRVIPPSTTTTFRLEGHAWKVVK